MNRTIAQLAANTASKKYFTPDEVADRLRLSVHTLANWRHQGKGPRFVKISRKKVLYASADIEAFEAASRRRPDHGDAR